MEYSANCTPNVSEHHSASSVQREENSNTIAQMPARFLGRQEDVLPKEELTAFLATLGRRIRKLREEKKLKMRDIMMRTGYYDAQWRKYEGGGSLTIGSLMKISLALEVTLVELLDGLGHWPVVSVQETQKEHGIDPASLPSELELEPESLVVQPSPAEAKHKRVAKSAPIVAKATSAKKAKVKPPDTLSRKK